MPRNDTIRRYAFFSTGLFVSAFGISLITKAGLGTSPISSVPYVLSFIYPLTFGQFTFVINMIMVGGQILILKKEFRKIQLLQIPVTLLFGIFIDATMGLLGSVHPSHYPVKIILLLLGSVVLGAGIAVQVRANALILPGEGLVKAIASVTGKKFGMVKTLFDSSLVCAAIALSLIHLSGITGLREGTVISALTVGSISHFFIRRLSNFDIPVREAENG
ncbi:MAG TPA: DUF6198 family protein [Spirochaetota bacterium]|nr:DUF6198 family protein [Spirochaetota bacterium]